MIGLSASRRRVNEFAHALEVGGRVADATLAPLTRVTQTLRHQGASCPGPARAFRDELREHLLVATASPPVVASPPTATSTRRRHAAPASRWRRRLAAIAASATVLTGTAGLGLASAQTAEPGDFLYGTKLAIEKFRLNIALSETAKVKISLEQTTTRIAEAERILARSNTQDADRVEKLSTVINGMGRSTARVQSLTQDLTESSELGSLRRPLEQSTAEQSQWLEKVQPQFLDQKPLVESFSSMQDTLADVQRQLGLNSVSTQSQPDGVDSPPPDAATPAVAPEESEQSKPPVSDAESATLTEPRAPAQPPVATLISPPAVNPELGQAPLSKSVNWLEQMKYGLQKFLSWG